MFCFRARKLIHRYLDHQIEPAVAVRLELHVKSCLGCAREFSNLVDLANCLQAAPAPKAPSDFTRRTLDYSLTRSLRPAAVHHNSWFPAAATACAMVTLSWAGFEAGRTFADTPESNTIHISVTAPVEPALFQEEPGW